MFHKSLDFSQAGDQVGVLVRGVKKDDVRRGMVLCAPGSVKSHTSFKAQVSLPVPPSRHTSTDPLSSSVYPTNMSCLQVYVLKEEEGGRHTPFMTNYCPQLYTRTADVGASMLLPSGIVFVRLVSFPELMFS